MTWIIAVSTLLLAATSSTMETALRVACVLSGVALLCVDRVRDRLDQHAKSQDEVPR